MPFVDQPTNAPTNKVTAATIWAAIASILSWADDRYWNDNVPGYVEAAVITLGVALVGYFVKNSSNQAPPAPGV